MQIEVKCKECGKSRIFTVEQQDFEDFINKKRSAKSCFPNLCKEAREFFVTGICEECAHGNSRIHCF